MIHVLYIDDEPDLLGISKIFLEKSGQMQVDTLTSAHDALERLAVSAYDAVISDYQMPAMDGISFLKALRSEGNSTPFILFTGRGREEVVIEALNNGADFYLQKGGDPEAQFAELEHEIRLVVGQRKMKAELLESQKRMADIIDFLPDATFAITLDGTVMAWNRAIAAMTGVSKEAMLGTGNYSYALPFYRIRRPILVDLVLHDDKKTEKNYLHVRREGDKIVVETYIPTLYGGQGAYVWAVASPLYDAQGRVIGAIESIRDITDRKKIENALFESERKYRNVVEDQTEFICRFCPDGTHVFVNEAYCRYFRKNRSEIIGKKFIPNIPAQDRLLVRKHFAGLSQAEPVSIIEHRIVMPSGEVRWQRWSDRAIFDASGRLIEYQSVGRDVTDMKHAQESIYREKLFSDATIECIPGAFFVVDQEGRYVRCNKFMEEALGLPADQICGTSATALVLEEDRPLVERAMAEVFSKGQGDIVARAMGARRRVREFILTGRRMDLGDAAYLVGTGIDMTEKYQSVRALEESEKRYRTLFDRTGTAMMILEEDMTVSLVNAEFEKISGYTKEEVEGKRPWTDFVVPEDAVWMKEYHIRRRQENAPSDTPQNYEFRFVDRNNTIMTMYLSIVLLTNRKQTIVSLVDITERKRLEAALQVTNKKLNLLSGLTRQDILNKLNLLQSALCLLETRIGDTDQRHLVEKAVRTGKSIQAQILFTKQYQDIGVKKPKWQDVYGVVMSVCRVGDFPGISVDQDLEGIEIFADPLLQAVFINLFENAFLHGGNVTRVQVSGAATPGQFLLAVEDDGTGIAPENKEMIFEKDFTNNTGFGLFLVQEVLAITGLSIRETGEYGKGARFEILVPEGMFRHAHGKPLSR